MMKKLLVILAVIYASLAYAQDETTLVKISDQVPSFEFEKSPGVVQNISESKGKLVLITFFATWCGPCRAELPAIQTEIFDKYKNNPDFELIILGREHNWDEVNKFKKDNQYTMPFYPDPERKIYSKFASQFIPRNFLISKDGKIIFNSIGFERKDFNLLKETIDNQLKKE
jgi:thiol-disulfide isomerase/thioredoxin